jgi:hypothetical protein
MTNHTNTTTTESKPALLLVAYNSKDSFYDIEFARALLTKAANNNNFIVKEVLYYPAKLLWILEVILGHFRRNEKEAAGAKVTVIPNNFNLADSAANDDLKLSTLIKENIIDVYQADCDIYLNKIEVNNRHPELGSGSLLN